MAVNARAEVDETPTAEGEVDPREDVVKGLRLEAEEARLRAELAKLTPNAPPDIGEQVTALAALVGGFQADLTNAVGPLQSALAQLALRVTVLEEKP